MFLLGTGISLSAQVSKTYQHWADGDAATGTTAQWQGDVLSANKSDYFEGEVIPHAYAFQATNNKPLVPNTEYTIAIKYNYYQGTNNAGGFAYIATYNVSRQPTTQMPGTATTIADLVQDNTFPSTPGSTGIIGSFYVTPNADITHVSNPVLSGSSSKDQTVTVKFTYTGATTSKTDIVVLYYGLYIAIPGQVPAFGSGTNPTKGAHDWSGGSLQTDVDGSIQLAPSAIIAGTISGYKWSDLNPNGAKTSDEPFLDNWEIYLDLNNNSIWDATEPKTTTATTTGAYSFSVTPDANKSDGDNDPYIVREVIKSNWTQTYPGASASPNAYAHTLTITSLTPNATGNFGNFICVNPTIVSPTIGAVCAGATSANIGYTSVTGSPDQYKIDWNTAANLANLLDDASYVSLPNTNPFSITIPGTLSPNTYSGTIYVKNSTTGCTSSGTSISITVKANPDADAGSDPSSQCLNSADGNTFTLNGSVTNGTASWGLATGGNPNNLTYEFGDASAASTTVKITGGYGSVTFLLTATSGSTPVDCGTDSDNVTVTVNDKPGAPSVCFILPSLCYNETTPTGTVLFSEVTGYSYSIDGTNFQPCRAFPGLAPGSVTSLKVTDANGCVSAEADCSQIAICPSNTIVPECETANANRMRTNNYETTEQQIVVGEQTKVSAFPNPFSDKVKFVVNSSIAGKGSLEVYNMLGQKVKTVYQGHMITGTQIFELSLPGQKFSNLIYVLRIGDKRISGKLLQLNR